MGRTEMYSNQYAITCSWMTICSKFFQLKLKRKNDVNHLSDENINLLKMYVA